MKFVTLFVFSFFSFACSQVDKKTNVEVGDNMKETIDNKKYGEELIENNFLIFANVEKIDFLKIELINSFNIYDDENNKFVQIDAEELSEFNFDFFLPQLNKILEKRNMNLIVKTASDYEKTNDIIINEEKINLYTKEQLDNKTFLDSAPRNFFSKVNEILKTKSLDEKFFLLYTGNDLSALLLTDKQFEIIKKYYENDPEEIPYLP
ncbi:MULTISPECIES: hypothetical protein [Empedobacter]|uniref:hypothetical protein n=1 Tax=Empedobacter TaxID=59734 RepID=UPI00126A74C5|nr:MULTISPECIES: hypothetical protein [Empedobacter]